MKKILIIFFLVLQLFLPLETMAKSYAASTIVMDIDSGRILYQHDSNTARLIASTTKIMTFLVTLDYAFEKLDDVVEIGDEVLKMYGTNMYLSLKEKVTLKDLLYGLMLRSGNDASVSIAVYVAGSIENFVYLMNEKASELGMQNTVFHNPHGLDEETENYSTAYDLAILTRYLYLNYPLYKQIAGSKYYDFQSDLKSYSLTNRCKILFNYKNITTAKNGYTPKAGKSLVTTATFDNLNLLIVTLDDNNIYENHKNLYEYYFKEYKNYKLLDKNNFQVTPGIFDKDYYIKKNFTYPLTAAERKKITTKIIVDGKESLGSVNILLDNEIIHEQKIYEKKAPEKKNSWFSKIKNFFANLF